MIVGTAGLIVDVVVRRSARRNLRGRSGIRKMLAGQQGDVAADVNPVLWLNGTGTDAVSDGRLPISPAEEPGV